MQCVYFGGLYCALSVYMCVGGLIATYMYMYMKVHVYKKRKEKKRKERQSIPTHPSVPTIQEYINIYRRDTWMLTCTCMSTVCVDMLLRRNYGILFHLIPTSTLSHTLSLCLGQQFNSTKHNYSVRTDDGEAICSYIEDFQKHPELALVR